MLILIHIVGIMLLATIILMLYACLVVNKDNKTERELKCAKKLIKEQNEKIILLESELDQIELEELNSIK